VYELLAVEAGAGLGAVESALVSSRARIVGLLDGSPVVTPRLIEHVLSATRLFAHPVIAVPGYELRDDVGEALIEEAQYERILSTVDWRTNTYDLFEVARFGRENPHGYLSSLVESCAFFCVREECLGHLRDPDGRVRTVNELYAALLRNASSRLVALGGEGCFRPPMTGHASVVDKWQRSDRQPTLFGVLPGQSHDFFWKSIGSSAMHEAIAREANVDEWRRDPRQPVSASRELDSRASAPRLSIGVVAFRSPRQIENTLYSLSARHQWNVSEDDYEIIVVENRSDDMLGEERARRVGKNVRYFLREETGVSPAPALNFAVAQAKANLLGLLIDGARMATPRVIEHALLAASVHPRPIIVVPGYHLGPGRQHLTSLDGYDESVEAGLLEGVDWKQSGYRLFDIACFDDATKSGFLNPMLEATYLFTARACFDEVGGLDERFDLEGGGEVNHDLFERICRLPNTRYVVLWGEGNFHQYHGGVSTKAHDRERKLELFRAQYDRIRGRRFKTYEREPWLLGTCCGTAHIPFREAASLGRVRFGIMRDQQRPEWENG
jgi:hypothetical protein